MITYEKFVEGLHPDDRDATHAAVERSLDPDNDGTYYTEYRVINRRDGKTRWIVAVGHAFFENRQPVRLIGTVQDISERKASKEHLCMVMTEMNHRVKNTLATIEALAVQSSANATDIQSFVTTFRDRIRSMAKAHSLLTRREWKGVEFAELLRLELNPRVQQPEHLTLEGKMVRLPPSQALALHMAIHELATNAAKYGPLGVPDGRLAVHWKIEDTDGQKELLIDWREEDGPPVKEPQSYSFGWQLVSDVISYELEGEVTCEWRKEGLRCHIRVPLTRPKGGARLKSSSKRKVEDGRPIVLLVEDSASLARLTAAQLTDLEWEVVGPAATLDKGIKLSNEYPLDAAILDVDLNGEPVFPLARKLTTDDVPFVMLTGFNEVDLPRDLAAARVLTKPVDLDALASWLGTVKGGKPA